MTKPPKVAYIQPELLAACAAGGKRGLKLLAVADLKHHPDNERLHNRANIDSIKGLMINLGIMEPIGVRDGLVIRGNGTMDALLELAAEQARGKWEGAPDEPLDWALVPAIVYESLTPAGATLWRVGHNQSAAYGEWDWEALHKTLRDESVPWAEANLFDPLELELLVQANWTPPEPPPAEGPAAEVSTAGQETTPLIIKIEGPLADRMRAHAARSSKSPSELVVKWAESLTETKE